MWRKETDVAPKPLSAPHAKIRHYSSTPLYDALHSDAIAMVHLEESLAFNNSSCDYCFKMKFVDVII